MHREQDVVAPREVAAEPFDAVGVDVRREVLDRRRQIDNHLLGPRWVPLGRDGLADLEREVELGVMEALRRVLEHDVRVRLAGEPLAHLGAAHGELGDAGLVEPEDDAPLCRRGRVVEVDDCAPRTVDRLERPLDQLRPRLREHRDRHVVGDQLLLDEHAEEVEGGGEADLDLLEAELDEQREEAALALRVHRVDERLIAVAQVGRAPDRRPVEHDVRPRPVGQVDGVVRAVLVERHRHGFGSFGEMGTHVSRGTVDGYVQACFPYRGRARSAPRKMAVEAGTTLSVGHSGRCGQGKTHIRSTPVPAPGQAPA